MKLGRFVTALLLGFTLCSSVRADDWDDAKDKAEKFIDHYEDLRKFTTDEVKTLVSQLCGYEDEDGESLFGDVRDRIKSEATEKLGAFHEMLEQANKSLDKITDSDAFKDKQSDAKAFQQRINDLYDRVERMTRSVRGGNHPVLAYMREAGQKAHSEYQSHSRYCDASEFSIGDGRVDCLYAGSCWVVEIKPANDKAMSKGRNQANDYSKDLNKDKDGKFTDLAKDKSSFADCSRKFAPKIVTYSLCPEINDDGDFGSTSYKFTDPQD